jgi:hypothetical protein
MTLRLERLRAFNAIGWQRHCEALETANADLQAQITAIATAQAAATAAAAAAAVVARNDKISGSATDPSVVVSASDAGASATITIAAHTRRYGDGTTLAVAGGSLTGKAYSTQYAVYYDDTTTANTTPTYVATTTLKDAQPNAVAGRHYVDQITTPAAAAPPTGGGGYRPPGGGGPYP